MKSTGLFGKNSGRVGGVVYSNYRGEQVVRSYQPKVSNPSTAKQVEQRSKFKLASQVGASFGREIALSFVPSVTKETPRNAFVKAMLKKAVYNDGQASLPIEDIVLTNSRTAGVFNVNVTDQQITGTIASQFSDNAKVHIVYAGYNSGGEINVLGGVDIAVSQQAFQAPNPASVFTGSSNIRALIYVFEPMTSTGVSYEDYEVLEEEATLNDYVRVYAGNLLFSETTNISIPRNV